MLETNRNDSDPRPVDVLVSFVIPVYNNKDSLPITIPKLAAFLSRRFSNYEIVFVDDLSHDGSLCWLQNLVAENRRMRVIAHRQNRGQQQAIATGMLAASGDVALTVDADLPCELAAIEKVALLALGGIELVLGRRVRAEPRAWWRSMGSKMGNQLFRILFPYEIQDFGCSTAAIRRSLIEKFRNTRTKVLLLKPQLLSLAASYVETEINPREFPVRGKSGYSILKLAGLCWLMLVLAFKFPLRR